MGVLLVLLIMAVFIYACLVVMMSIMAYHEGKDDATRYYGSYDNSFWMPMAFAYDYGYNKWDGKKRVTIKSKNRKRFNRG